MANVKTKRRPRYLALADDLTEGILTGRYPVGTLLPSEFELCEHFDVSRYTVREAIRHVQLSGLVSRRQGLGTRVEQAEEHRQFTMSLESIEEVERYGRDTRLVDVITRNIIADETLVSVLDCELGQRFLYTQSYRVPRDQSISLPVGWHENYIVDEYSDIRDELSTLKGPIYSLLERRFGERVVEIRQDISAINLDESTALRLHVQTGAAGLRINRRYIGRRGAAILHGINIYPGDRFTFTTYLNQ